MPFERPPNSQDSRSPSESLSYYVQDYMRLLRGRLNLVGGLRWIDPRSTIYNDLNRTTIVTERGREQVHRYGVVLKPFGSGSFYASEATTFLVNSGVDHFNRPLRNSVGRNREVGFKFWDVAVGAARLFGSGAYFDMSQTNIRTTGAVVVVNGVSVTEVLQTAADISRGLELDVGGRIPVGPGELEGIFTHYVARSRAASGSRSVRTPRHVTSLLLKYSINRGRLKHLAFGAGGYFEGDKLATADGRLLHDFPDLYDGFVSFQINARWSLRVNIENLTNIRFVHSYLSPGLVGSNEPRSVRLSIRHVW